MASSREDRRMIILALTATTLAAAWPVAYHRGINEQRRHAPRGDLISRLLEADAGPAGHAHYGLRRGDR